MRTLRVSGWVLIAAGLLIFAFLGYQLGVTTFFTARAQDQLQADLAERWEEERLPPPTADPLPDEAAEPADPPPLFEETPPEEGEPLGRITIPAAGVDAILVEGVRRDDLKMGPGHMPWTPLPGQPGNAVVSGHRTTYGAPFYDLDLLEPGDEIVVETALGRHVYVVRELVVVDPTGVWVTEDRPGAWLTLTTCHPRFSARERLVVFAELEEGPNHPYVAALEQERAEELSGAAS